MQIHHEAEAVSRYFLKSFKTGEGQLKLENLTDLD